MARFTVRVLDNEQKPWKGIPVALGFTGLTRGMSATVYTDANGRAEFNGYGEGGAKVFIRGDSYGVFDFRNGAEVTLRK